MNIVFIVSDYSGKAGGIRTYVHTVANALSGLGHHVTVMSPVLTPPPGARYALSPVTPEAPPTARRIALSYEFARALRVLNRARRIDVVEATDWGMEGVACLGTVGAPVVVRLHTPNSVVDSLNEEGRALDRDAVNAGENEYFCTARFLSSPSHAMARLFTERWSIAPDRITVIPNPVAIEEIATGGPATPPPIAEGFQLAYVGRLERRKGVFVLARALASVLGVLGDARAVFAGHDTRSGSASIGVQLRRILAEFPGRVRFEGRLEHDRVIGVLGASHLVVLPSLWENFPYACLEAMACSRPVLASAGSGFDEIIRPGVDGYLVAPRDPGALASALIAARSADLLTMGRAARNNVVRFDARTVAYLIESYYRRVVAAWNQK